MGSTSNGQRIAVLGRTAAVCALIAAPGSASAQRIFGTYKVIPAGSTAKVGFHYIVRADCRSEGTTTVNVVTPPKGGEILTAPGSGHTHFAARSKFARCNGRLMPGTDILYRASPDFTGTDSFVVEDVYPDGTARQFPMTVSVR